MKKEPSYITYLFWIIAIILLVTVLLTKTTAYKEKNVYYDEQIEASKLASNCFDVIKQYKLDNGISLSEYDKYNCGMIGYAQTNDNTEVTTTMGDLNAKLTACNPNFAALYIEYFRQAGVKKGDEVAICCSGSFPTLNISALCACQVFGLKVCFMSSVGASTYGANSANFTFFDMAEILYSQGLIDYRIDYVSFGGDDDTGKEFIDSITWLVDDVKLEDSPYYKIKKRIEDSGITFLSIENFEENINTRMNLIFEKCPNCKLLISVGGNIMTMGIENAAEDSYKGLVTSKISYFKKQYEKYFGLMDRFLLLDKPVIQMLNIKGICLENGISYSPDTIPSIGTGNMYYQISYNLFIPILALIITIGLGVWYFIYRLKIKKVNGSIL